MKNKTLLAVVALVVILVGVYGAYRVYKHYKRSTAMQPVTTTDQMQPATNEPAAPAATPATGTNANSVYETMTGQKGGYIADPKGMALYTYDKDTAGVSNCSGQCLVNWPAYIAPTGTTGTLPADISLVRRSDGSMQYAWDGKALYYFIGDKNAGDTNGDGVGGIWHLVMSK